MTISFFKISVGIKRYLGKFFCVTQAYALDKKSLDALRARAKSGESKALLKLVGHLMQEKDELKDWNEIIHWLDIGKTCGIVEAQTLLGLMYREGYGVPIDIDESIRLLTLAAKQNHLEAIVHLAGLEYESKGLIYDDNIVEDALTTLAEKKNPFALYNFAERIIGKSKNDLKEAKVLLEKSAEQGNLQAKTHLEAMKVGEKCEFYETSFHFLGNKVIEKALRILAEKGNPFAQNNLAERLILNVHTGKYEITAFFVEAKDGFRILANKGDVFAQSKLATMYQEGKGVPINPKLSLKWHQKAARLGFPKSQFEAGKFLYYGAEGVNKILRSGINLIERAAKHGVKEAIEEIDRLFFDGYSETFEFPAQPANAVSFLNKAEEHARKNLIDDLCHMIIYGKCKVTDKLCLEKGIAILPMELPDPKTIVGADCSEITDITDTVALAKWFNKLALQGNPIAQRALGILYYRGQVVSQNLSEAIKYLKKAAIQGDAISQTLLGGIYADDNSYHKNLPESIKWLRIAADQGNPYAQNNLGVMYYRGLGVPMDRELSKKLFLKSLRESGLQVAILNLILENFYDIDPNHDIEPNHKGYTDLFDSFKHLSEVGIHEADFYMGICYTRGVGVDINSELAVSCFQKAAEKDIKLAKLYLGAAHIIGYGTPKDIAKGVIWIEKAAEQNVGRAMILQGILITRGLCKTK
ncbi:MAG: sel1 repeat family protein, partial [Deltaproteobacteria bacterium]|nr:sel1 repeat family protein [Deltaproteobacteria bacterium]